MQCLSTAHAFDYIALRINPALTSCKDLASVVDISLNNNYSACNASYVLPYSCIYYFIYYWLYSTHKVTNGKNKNS